MRSIEIVDSLICGFCGRSFDADTDNEVGYSLICEECDDNIPVAERGNYQDGHGLYDEETGERLYGYQLWLANNSNEDDDLDY
jgi:hypothetical protein